METILELQNLSCGYGARVIIHSLNLSVKQGEFISFIGPNGAGKSTLFKAISGSVPVSSGAIHFKGQDLKTASKKKRAQLISLQPQVLRIDSPFTVQEFVMLGRFPWKAQLASYDNSDRKVVLEALEATGTIDLRHRILTELSGGEMQRVLIAQALAQTPQIVLLDEPSAHLDIGHQIEIMDVLAKLNCERNLTVMVNSHDLNLASEYSHRMALLHFGNLLKVGEPAQVLDFQLLEAVYQTKVVVGVNPTTGRPNVFPVPSRVLRRN
jgi:iron complex transport system ATP-binding protein